ncbi:hypothetical protein N665_0231s0030 [Sinapis alba]|nr:hypothetical protein N665_0231s0030 [Sinapis alba]
MIGISGSVADVVENDEPVSPSPPSGDSFADRSHSDLNQAAAADVLLINEFKNVCMDEVSKEKMMMSGVVDSKAVEEEEEDGESEQVLLLLYPVRPGAEDCAFYMRTGTCKFGSTCKFNHPLPNPRKFQIARESKVREKEEEDADKMMDCKYYFRTGGCKYGVACRFNHSKPKSDDVPSAPELNFLGLPIRPGEIECLFYMRNGSCKFGADCKFNHPDPTTLGGTDSPSFHGNNGGSIGSFSPKSTFHASSTSWSSPRHANGTAPFIPSMLSQTRGASSQPPEWNGYQASSMYPSERSVFSTSTTYLMNNPSAETSIFTPYKYQKPAEEFPERPDQPECSYYLKTGDCKFKFTCKYHHPKNRLPKQPPYALNDKGLPLRPDQVICTHYSRYGICKFGPACRFDHSIQLPDSTVGSSHAVVEPPLQVGANGNESDGWN